MRDDDDGSAISRLLAESRRGPDRVEPADLAALQADGALVVDIRPVEQRRRDGDLPAALVIDRNVLEWRLDPSSPHRLPTADDPGRRIVLVCNEGYSSSLAAHTLRRLGLVNATDLRGGFQAWADGVADVQAGTYGGRMAEGVPDAADPDVMDMFDADSDSRAAPALVCRVCGSLVAAAGEYPKAHWDWHEASNGA